MQLWKFFHFFKSHNYSNSILLNLLHWRHWEKHNLPAFQLISKCPVMMNEEIGEITLSVLTRKMKVSHSSHHLKKVCKDFSP